MSEYVWVAPTDKGEFEVSIGARIISRDARRVKILDDEGQERWVEATGILRPMHFTSVEGVEDMIVLGDLQEHAILRNLLIRYCKDLIYTYTGTMLIAVNPYKQLPIYSTKEISLYKGRKIGDLPPHIFAVGDNSYRNMRDHGKKQCIVISGESGAGKTESTKLILQYVATISQKHSWIEQQILDSNPVLEAFGNARTVRNDNSSRFGKYIALLFDQDYSISGAKIEQYLLEKSRLVSQNEGERNYHIFYALLAGLGREEKIKWDLEDAGSYRYLNGGKILTCEGRDESVEFANIKAAMKVLNFSDTDIESIFQLLAAILHMGNFEYKRTMIENMEGCELLNAKKVENVAALLGANVGQLTNGLIRRSLTTQNETVSLVLSVQQAAQVRDAFVKAIYGNLFIYIVNKINLVIKPKTTLTDRYLGVLDIFGFENFANNSFEQLCINLANENLQQFFIHHIFKLEQEQYTNEGIDWKQIKFVDNQAILDMIVVKPMSIFSLIDEEAKFPKGTDETMLAKIIDQHESKAEFFRPKYRGVEAFGVYHFAGAVFYNIKDFLEKDRDSFSVDLKTIAESSKNQFLRALFPIQTGNTLGTKKKDTLALKFRQSLDELMTELQKCRPFFVRCVKPNELKKPRIFDRPLCCRQLRYSGMMETAKVRQAGFPIRYPYQQFVERYRVLGKAIPPARLADCKAATAQICNAVFGGKGEYRLGYTKVFLKTSEDVYLDSERNRVLANYILVLQKNIRGWLQRRRYQKLRKAAIYVQSHWRGKGPRMQYLAMLRGYTRLQARIRSRLMTYHFVGLRRRIVRLQAYCKGYAVRQAVRRQIRDNQGKMKELMEMRRKEETELKRAGKKDWKETAMANWRARLVELNIRVREEEEEVVPQAAFDEDDEEEQAKLVDNVFGFLDNDSSSSTLQELGIGRGNLHKGEDYIGLSEYYDDGEDLSEFNFRKYAATYFRGNVIPYYQRKPLRHALLDSTHDFDAAARALSITIHRFMGDIAESRYERDPQKATTPIMAQISQTLGRKFTQSAAFREALAAEKDEAKRKKMISMTLKRSNKISADIRQAMLNENDDDSYADWLNAQTSNLDKLHFIIGHGILKPELRDEIFAQVCKQLTKNPTKTSFSRGWVLLSLCVGCFAPSEVLLNPLKSFLKSGPEGYAKFCLYRLKRTGENGARSQPPSWVELQAIKYKKPIDIPVSLMDGSKRTVQVDSAMTSSELLKSVLNHIELTDSFGFSVYIKIGDKISSLGAGRDHVLDAVSQCEQYAREQGQLEKNAAWKISVRKEMFAPWHDSAEDMVATQLISQQILKGLIVGEYRCEREADLAMFAAQQYYIEHGLLDLRILTNELPRLLPIHIYRTLNKEKMDRWIKLIQDAYNKNLKLRPKINQVKQDIVNFAKMKWPLWFSRYMEVIELNGQTALPKQRVIAALNSNGVSFIDNNTEQVLLELSFVEIQSMALKQPGSVLLLHLITIEGIEMVLQGPDTQELHDSLQNILAEIRKRSKYVVATQNYNSPEGNHLIKGDLLRLTDKQTGESVGQGTWVEAFNERTDETAHYPTDCVAVITSMVAPTPAVLELLKEGPAAVARAPGVGTIRRMRLYTLENYARDHFRVAGRVSTISRGTSLSAIRQNEMEELWRHSREPIKRPLLRRLQGDNELSAYACIAYLAMLKYMGDLPSNHRMGSEYTDKIFEAALKHEPLRDEIYCQIMKQLTGNRNQLSNDRGWELMYLITGLFPCSSELEKELLKFLQSRRSSDIAQDCQLRFQRIIVSGARRYPPPIVEIDAIQHKHKQIYHRVYFPNDADDAFEVDSFTRVSELIAKIGKKLQMKSCDGFSLFIKIGSKVLAFEEKGYFFDFVRLIADWIKQTAPGENAVLMQYQIFFMRKLWTGAVAGRDRNADLIFHYPQELPKYLRGYHKVSKNDAAHLATLIYIAKFDDSGIETATQQTIQGMIPPDVYKQQKPKEWQKSLTSAMKEHKGLTADDAKIEFLRFIQQWPTFGSAFFEVKQTSETNYPELILVAINRRGVSIINPNTKLILAEYEYTHISNWSSGNTYFNMNIGFGTRGGGSGRLLMETPLGYKMDDLLRSYTNMLHTMTLRRKSIKASRAPLPPMSS